MVLIRSDSCSRVLGIPHPAAPPPLATWSRTGCRERSNGQAYCFDRGQRTIGHCRELGCSGFYRLLAASNFRRSVYCGDIKNGEILETGGCEARTGACVYRKP